MFKHGMIFSPIYFSWRNLKGRCLNVNDRGYKNYGGRGIKVCERWLKFENFLKDMGPTWKKGLTLDRINVNGDYKPSNCRWATSSQQQNNRRDNIKYKGETMAQASRRLGLSSGAVFMRIKKGWSIKKAFTVPHKEKKRIRYKGETIQEAAERLGLTSNTLFSRLKVGWSYEKAFSSQNLKKPKNNYVN
jgi:hypothetical protein